MATIVHAGQEWEIRRLGIGTGVGVGAPPDATDWLVDFCCLSDPERPPLKGSIPQPDPDSLSEQALRRALESALVADALERASAPLTLSQIAAQTHLSEESVQGYLHGIPHRTHVAGHGPGSTVYVSR